MNGSKISSAVLLPPGPSLCLQADFWTWEPVWRAARGNCSGDFVAVAPADAQPVARRSRVRSHSALPGAQRAATRLALQAVTRFGNWLRARLAARQFAHSQLSRRPRRVR